MVASANSHMDAPVLSESALIDNFIGLLIAGHDTTASTISCALYHLAQSPEALAELRAEQSSVVNKHGIALTSRALAEMPFTEAVLRETCRLHPVVPVVGRVSKCNVELGEYAVPAGQRTFVALNTVTRGSAWRQLLPDDPLHASVFAPARWLPGTQEAATAAALQMPFGAGPRSCIGVHLAWAEAKCLLAMVSRSLRFAVDPSTTTWKAFPFPVVCMSAACSRLERL